MADRTGYILIDRNILDWKWWQKHNTLIVFMWLLLKANFHESYFAGVKVERGQVVTTIGKIESNNKMTRQEVKTSLVHLKSTGEINIERHPQFLVITIVNYDRYQNLNIESNNDQTSNKHHSEENQTYPNTYNNQNKRKKKKEKGRSAPEDFPETVDEILPERDLDGYPSADEMPCEADGTKRDIPPRVRHLFPEYGAYWRYMHR